MKNVLFCLFAALGLFISSEAFATPAVPGDPPKCADNEECKKLLETCKTDLNTSKSSAEAFLKERDVCLDKLKNLVATTPTLPPVKHVQVKCVNSEVIKGKTYTYGGIKSDGKGGCDCTDPETYVAVVKKSFQQMVCVPHAEAFRILKMEVDALKGRGIDTSELETRVNEVTTNTNKFAKLYEELVKDYVDLTVRVGVLEAWKPAVEATIADHEERLRRLESLNQSPWTTGVLANLGLLVLPGAGVQGFASLQWANTVYFNKTTPVGLKLEVGAGRMFGNSGIGAGWILDGSLGPVFNLHKRYVELGAFVTGKQLISDHENGYQGVLGEQGMGFLVGGEVELNINLVDHLDFGVEGGLGFASANHFAGPSDLRHDKGLGGFLGIHVGGHTEIVPGF